MVTICGCVIIVTIVINRRKRLKQHERGQKPPTHVVVNSIDISVGDQYQKQSNDKIMIIDQTSMKSQNTFGEYDDEVLGHEIMTNKMNNDDDEVLQEETLGMEMDFDDNEKVEDEDVNTNGFIGNELEAVVDVDVNNEEIKINTQGFSLQNDIHDDEFIVSNDETLE